MEKGVKSTVKQAYALRREPSLYATRRTVVNSSLSQCPLKSPRHNGPSRQIALSSACISTLWLRVARAIDRNVGNRGLHLLISDSASPGSLPVGNRAPRITRIVPLTMETMETMETGEIERESISFAAMMQPRR